LLGAQPIGEQQSKTGSKRRASAGYQSQFRKRDRCFFHDMPRLSDMRKSAWWYPALAVDLVTNSMMRASPQLQQEATFSFATQRHFQIDTRNRYIAERHRSIIFPFQP
jgi:hypothetical protein